MAFRAKVNLLFVLIQSSMGGTERVVLDLARNLNRDKFNVYVAFFISGALEEEFKKICQGVFHIQKGHGFDFLTIMRISSLIRKYNIDVINAHHYMPLLYSFIGSKMLNKKKLIYTEHSVPEVESILSGKHRKLLGPIIRKIDSVVGVSNEIADTFRNAFPESREKCQAIPNGVDVDRFINSISREDLREKWGILPEHFVIGTIANFRKVKNHVCLIKAINQISDTHPQVRVVLVGQGFPRDEENSEDEVITLIKSYGLKDKIILTGYQEDIPGLLKIFDIFCLPSLSEGLPVSVLEAMASRLPVVGSNVRGIKEVISSGKTGILFTSNDVNDLSQALLRIINNKLLRNNISRNAFSYVCQNHKLSNWVLSYERLFEKSLDFQKCSHKNLP